MEFGNIPFKLIILLLLQAFWIFIFFAFVQHLLVRLIKRERLQDWLSFYTPIIRNVVWIIFAVRIIYLLGKFQPLLVLAIAGIVIALLWSVLRDFVQGTLFRLQKGDIVGQQIKVENYKGKVIQMGETKLSIELKNGEIVQIPYHKLFTNVIIKPIANRDFKKQTIVVPFTSSATSFNNIKRLLTKRLLAYPWVVIKNGVNVELFTEPETNEQKIKIAYAIDTPTRGVEIQEEIKQLLKKL